MGAKQQGNIAPLFSQFFVERMGQRAGGKDGEREAATGCRITIECAAGVFEGRGLKVPGIGNVRSDKAKDRGCLLAAIKRWALGNSRQIRLLQ
jgi:hypothetical protein